MSRHSRFIPLLLATILCQPALADDADPFPLGGLGGKALQSPGSGLLKLTEVPAGSPAAVAGLQVGDFIHAVNGVTLPVTSTSINDGWRGAVTALGYAIERAESSGTALSLGVLRPGTGALTRTASLAANPAWRPSYPTGDPRAAALFDKVCADLHTKIQASTDGSFGANTGWFAMILLASPDWNSTSGSKPYRNSINKLRDRCLSHLNGRILEPVEPNQAGYVSPGLENWDLCVSSMFIGEYRRKTGDTGVDAAVQRCALLLANRIQHYAQPDDGGTMHNKPGIMGHGGVTGDYAHLWLTGLNIINAHTMVAMGILKGAGADFSAIAGSSGLTIDQKFLMNWSWLKKCTRTDNGSDDGCVGYQGVESGWDAAGRTTGTAAGYQIYLRAGGTTPTADDLDKLGRQQAYVVRHWQRQQHAHAYTAGGVALSQSLMPFLDDRGQRYFMENSRFYYTLTRDHTGAIQYVPGRGNNGGDSSSGYLGFDNVKYYFGGLFHAMGTGNLPSFPAPSAERAFVRMKSPANDWPQLAARRARVLGLSQTLDLEVTNHVGTVLTGGYGATWSQVSGATVSWSTTTIEDTTVTFPAAGNYRLRLTAAVGSYTVTEDYDFEVATGITPPVANTITRQPVSRVGSPGGSATFTVTTAGTGPFLYEWLLNGTAYWGSSSNPTLTCPNISSGHAGSYTCNIYTPTGTLTTTAATLSIPTTTALATGGLLREVWTGLSGSSVTNLTGSSRYPLFPDATAVVTTAEGPNGYADAYGQRLSGWLIPPGTGQYKFFLTSDDASELWLSTTASAANKVRIAQVGGYTSYRAYASGGKSALISLVAGQRYYLEALHKDGGGGDHLSIAWQLPGGAAPADGSEPISGAYLQYLQTTGDPATNGLVSWWQLDDAAGTLAIDSLATANDGTLAGPTWTSGKRQGALVFDGNDRITCANLGALDGLTPFTVAAWVRVNAGAAQEMVVIQQRASNGFNGQYQLKVTNTGKIGFYVYGDSAQQFSFAGATSINDGQWHHIAAVRDDAGNAFVYLDGSQNGSVTGTTLRNLSDSIDLGIGCDIRDSNRYFLGRLDDIRVYNRALSQLEIAGVAALSNAAPAFTSNPLGATAAYARSPYSASLAGTATDPDGDPVSYRKVGGPAWLTVAADGTLSGTPTDANAGSNSFTIRAVDPIGSSADVTLTLTVHPARPLVTITTAGTPAEAGPVAAEFIISRDLTNQELTVPLIRSGTASAADHAALPTSVILPAGVASATVALIPVDDAVADPAETVTLTIPDDPSYTVLPPAAATLTIADNDGPQPVSPPWTAQDVGAVLAGANSATVSTGAGGNATALFNVIGSGSLNTANTADGLHFVALSVTGDCNISARVVSHSGTTTNHRVGVAIRADLTEGAVAAQTVLRGGTLQPYFLYRAVAGAGGTSTTYASSVTAPYWVRLVRVGNTFTSFVSPDGTNWSQLGSAATLASMPATARVGLFVASGSTTATNTATFDNVAVHFQPPDPDVNDNGILDAWELQHFGSAAPGANPPGADADGDGITNLMEYALDTDPLVSTATPLGHDLETVDGESYLRLTVPKNLAATNLTYTVETCGDLTTWSAASTVIETDTPGQLVVRDSVSAATSQRRFIRLRVQVLP